MLNSIIEQCKVMSISDIYLEVRISNINAIVFYEKFGFKKDAIRENYYTGEKNEDAILMSKTLSK